jgi:hypothetical protein
LTIIPLTQSEKGFDTAAKVRAVNGKNTDANQGTFAFLRASVQSNGDGTFTIKAGKPVLKLTPAQFAAEVGLSRDSVYRRIEDGSIPPEHVEYAGPRKIVIHSPALDHFREHWKNLRAETAI